jgi:hypothetical protein
LTVFDKFKSKEGITLAELVALLEHRPELSGFSQEDRMLELQLMIDDLECEGLICKSEFVRDGQRAYLATSAGKSEVYLAANNDGLDAARGIIDGAGLVDFNRAHLSIEPLNVALNDAIERAVATTAELPRPYLGASIAGDECLRKVQFDWWCKPVLAARTREIFARGHYFEDRARQHLIAIGFKFAPPEALPFTAANGALRGHADGIIIAGPDLPGMYFNYPFVWECKAINAKNWRALERDGLEKTFPKYAAQVALYQAYLDITNPALFTAVNADTCELLHLLIPFNAERAQAASDRAVMIIEATRASELLPRAYDDPSDWRCRMCAHVERCWR